MFIRNQSQSNHCCWDNVYFSLCSFNVPLWDIGTYCLSVILFHVFIQIYFLTFCKQKKQQPIILIVIVFVAILYTFFFNNFFNLYCLLFFYCNFFMLLFNFLPLFLTNSN